MTDRTEIDFAMLEASEDFWKEVESECERLEITVDYYLMEFY